MFMEILVYGFKDAKIGVKYYKIIITLLYFKN
jgi:hypothetical protein